MPTVNSVAGPVDTADLGFTLMHEHIIVESPGVKENFPIIDREAEIDKAAAKLKDVMARGVKTLVDLTPGDWSDIPLVKEVVAEQQHAGDRRNRHLLAGAAPLPLDYRPEHPLLRRAVHQGHQHHN